MHPGPLKLQAAAVSRSPAAADFSRSTLRDQSLIGGFIGRRRRVGLGRDSQTRLRHRDLGRTKPSSAPTTSCCMTHVRNKGMQAERPQRMSREGGRAVRRPDHTRLRLAPTARRGGELGRSRCGRSAPTASAQLLVMCSSAAVRHSGAIASPKRWPRLLWQVRSAVGLPLHQARMPQLGIRSCGPRPP